MKINHLGCVNLAGVLAALLVLAGVVGVSVARGGVLYNPGPLNAQAGLSILGGVRSHAELGGRCSACHATIFHRDRLAERCLACHTDLLANLKSFHGIMLSEEAVNGCLGCHTEHHGAQASLTLTELQDFPHEQVGFSLQAHQRMADGKPFSCSDCHGEKIKTLSSAVCVDCHAKLDEAFMSAHIALYATGCLACHDGVDRYGKGFDHARLAFPLKGKHAEVTCAGCHPSARSTADLEATPTDCFACHAKDNPHSEEFGTNCASCHTPEDWMKATLDHNLTGFPLVGKHASLECQACHQDGFYRGTPQDCFACHASDDTHQGRLGTNCAKCHTPEDWKKATIDHNLTGFPLTGKHASVECQSCHTGGEFQNTPADCYTCHAADDAHQGEFGTDCAACHTPESWQAVTFDHSKSSFPLTGAHASLACAQCHTEGKFKGTPTACAACHRDPAFHQGLFGVDCAACHSTRAWIPASFRGAHSFPLDHGGAGSCRDCHTDTLRAYTCYTCHNRQEIAGKHQEEGIRNFENCMQCHPTGQKEEGEGGGEGGGDD